ncbi:adenosylcobinamide amidohydrolase [Actinoplanes campanulatus]|uniref:Adenosylcobinamide amidohydrolase n=1 Tax=Actinoplanes campanulatus TaxID=113559 RepID=A0A7W5FBU4_9ACTN|nr:adenosylcobinamide amidohydrolase [Actinoplanes campanulatus]MBB3092739.1 adenosylcobinamide amidohydrolase [Actinoplanes campanulatus]GGM98669.1 adenosylcobinamide amidohydrolase [Actinoplanes campanulatus]GID34163.1 adenosylcobinamide amidohydrolase [Actinoplanes campanulatus]
MFAEPSLTHRQEDGLDVPMLLWRFPQPLLAASSAVLGGGTGPREWLVNASVAMSYARPDPDVHLAGLAAGLGLTGPGIGLLTGVDVTDVVAADDDGVQVHATVGLGAPIQAADPEATGFGHRPGTINIVVWVPQRLADGALINAIATATEAKVQALAELGLAATGTATDAVCVLCPLDGPPAAYGGPRSRWGAPLARAVHRAVLDGGATNLATGRSWSGRVESRT